MNYRRLPPSNPDLYSCGFLSIEDLEAFLFGVWKKKCTKTIWFPDKEGMLCSNIGGITYRIPMVWIYLLDSNRFLVTESIQGGQDTERIEVIVL